MVTYYSNVQRDGGRDLTIQELAAKFESAERAVAREGETVQDAKRRTYAAVQFGQTLEGVPTGVLTADYDHCHPIVAERLFRHCSLLPWVMMCGYSHSGGVWAAWRVAPDVTPDEVFDAMAAIGEMSRILTITGDQYFLDRVSLVPEQLRYVAPCSVNPTASHTGPSLYWTENASLFERPTSDRHRAYRKFFDTCGGHVAADVTALMLPSAACPGGIVCSRGQDAFRYRAQVQILGAMGSRKTSLMTSIRKAFESCGADIKRPGSARALEQDVIHSIFTPSELSKGGKPLSWERKASPTPVLLLEDENAEHVGGKAEFMTGFRRVIRQLADNEISVQSTISTTLPSGFYNHAISSIGASTHDGWAKSCRDVNAQEGELRRQYFADLGKKHILTPLGVPLVFDATPLLALAPIHATYGMSDVSYAIEVPDGLLLAHGALVRAFGTPAMDTRAYQSACAMAFWSGEGESSMDDPCRIASGMTYESLLCGHAIALRGAEVAEGIAQKAMLVAGTEARGLDGARAQIQARLLADGGGPQKAPAFRKWKSRSASKSLDIAYKELKAEGRIKVDAKTIEWVEIVDTEDACQPGPTPPPVLTPEEVKASLDTYKSGEFLQREADAVRRAGDGRRAFMLKVRGSLYRRGLWGKADEWYRGLGEYVGLDSKRLEALIKDKITMAG